MCILYIHVHVLKKEDAVWLPMAMKQLFTRDQNDTEIYNFR